VLVVFCRRPQIDAASRDWRARWARQMRCDRAGAAGVRAGGALAWPGGLVIAPENPTEARWAQGLLEREASVQPQARGNLGERLNAVDRAVRALGHERVLFIGSDAPSLTLPDLLAAAS